MAAYASLITGRYPHNTEAEELHWRTVLAGIDSPTPLPFDRPRTSVAEVRTSADAGITLSEADTAALHAFARANRLTASAVVQGAWALLLAQYSGRSTVCFGTTVSGRPSTTLFSPSMGCVHIGWPVTGENAATMAADTPACRPTTSSAC